MTDGQKIKELRRIIGIVEKCTQKKFAEMIGTATSVVGNLEIDKRRLTAGFKRRILKATGAHISKFYDYPAIPSFSEGEIGKYERYESWHYKEHKKKKNGWY